MSAKAATVGLVACGKQKQPGIHTARYLYTSSLFKKSIHAAIRRCGRTDTFILSAKYGLLDVDQPVRDYDQSLAQLSPECRKRWAQFVVSALIFRYHGESRLRLITKMKAALRAAGRLP